MPALLIRHLRKGTGPKHGCPVHVVWIDQADIKRAEVSKEEALLLVGKDIHEAVAINIMDMEVLTTTSDGLVALGAIVMFAAVDRGKIHPEFGLLPIKGLEVTEEMIQQEPHTRLAKRLFPGKPIYRGADYRIKNVPIHNSVMSGRTVNNNSGTEVMDVVTMEEMLLPILGQLAIMKEEEILLGLMGEVLSVGIGMSITENFSRSQPFMKCKPGDTVHASGKYAQHLKSNLPCILATKKVLAQHILLALKEGLRPGLELGVSPAVLMVVHYLGLDFEKDRVTAEAREELAAVGIDVDEIGKNSPCFTEEEIIQRADDVIPGVKEPLKIHSKEIVEKRTIPICR